LTDRLWGESFTTPGGAEYAIDFIQLLDLSEKKGLLNVGAGLGGAARAMVKEKGVWVTGLEAFKELAEEGMERSVMAALARKAPITHFDPEEFSLRERSFNAVVAFETFYTIRDKERLFKALEKCLRIDGDLLFTDFVLPDDRAPDAKVKQWFVKEPVRPNLWTVKRTVSILGGLNFDVRVAEDITQDYRRMVLAGWFAFVESLTKAELTPVFAADIVGECEYWLHRMDALDSGGVRLYRFHAEHLADRRS
jgi:cyclopropane fatty-acyl-phospholipid synthase-like methyltransferase